MSEYTRRALETTMDAEETNMDNFAGSGPPAG
jgi:hypothetical protein